MRPFVLMFLVCVAAGLTAQPIEKRANTSGKLFDIPSRRTRAVPEIPSTERPSLVEYTRLSETDIPRIRVEDVPEPPRFIMGKGEVGAELLASFLLSENQDLEKNYAETLSEFYIAEAEAEGINHDVAFAQMCLETGFLRFGGLVVPEMNNFCGLGSIGPGEEGLWFPSVELGVRAHIQHLKAYASDKPLQGDLIDPRFRFVRRGRAPTVDGLAGTWAADKRYAHKLEGILGRLESLKVSRAETPRVGKNR